MAGSSAATCSAIGSSAIPEMRERGYSARLSAGLVAAGGTLGILLPPSITMILYAVAAEVSLGRLFLAGIGPGLLLVALSILGVVIVRGLLDITNSWSVETLGQRMERDARLRRGGGARGRDAERGADARRNAGA